MVFQLISRTTFALSLFLAFLFSIHSVLVFAQPIQKDTFAFGDVKQKTTGTVGAQTSSEDKLYLLTEVPGLDTKKDTDGNFISIKETPANFGSFIKTLFKLFIVLIATSAVLVITYHGFLTVLYSGQGNVEGAKEGKERLKAGLWSLFLVLTVVLIINTVNDKFLSGIDVLDVKQPDTEKLDQLIRQLADEKKRDLVREEQREEHINMCTKTRLGVSGVGGTNSEIFKERREREICAKIVTCIETNATFYQTNVEELCKCIGEEKTSRRDCFAMSPSDIEIRRGNSQ